jgi:hypothetical protein
LIHLLFIATSMIKRSGRFLNTGWTRGYLVNCMRISWLTDLGNSARTAAESHSSTETSSIGFEKQRSIKRYTKERTEIHAFCTRG